MANKLRYFIANWKMFGNHRSFNVLYSTYKYLAKKKRILKKSRIIFCIPSTLIHNFAFRLKKTPIKIGAQNCHYDEISSSITGSVNADMLKKAGAEYIIIGHSENRAQGDTNKIILRCGHQMCSSCMITHTLRHASSLQAKCPTCRVAIM